MMLEQFKYIPCIIQYMDSENTFLGRNKHSLLRLRMHVERFSGHVFRMFHETKSHLKRNTFHRTGVHETRGFRQKLAPAFSLNLSERVHAFCQECLAHRSSSSYWSNYGQTAFYTGHQKCNMQNSLDERGFAFKAIS